jgi:hypothetical protein
MQYISSAAYGCRGKYFVFIKTLIGVWKGLIQSMVSP